MSRSTTGPSRCAAVQRLVHDREGFTSPAGRGRHARRAAAICRIPAIVDEGIDRTIDNWRAWSTGVLLRRPVGGARAAQRAGAEAADLQPHRRDRGRGHHVAARELRAAARTGTTASPGCATSRTPCTRSSLRAPRGDARGRLVAAADDPRERPGAAHLLRPRRRSAGRGAASTTSPGWRGIGPVVTGNPAQGQLQLGVYGDLFAICRTYVDAGNVLDAADRSPAGRGRRPHLRPRGATRTPACGSSRAEQHYTSSKMGCWQALGRRGAPRRAGQIAGQRRPVASRAGAHRGLDRRELLVRGAAGVPRCTPGPTSSTPRCCCTRRAASTAVSGCPPRSTRSASELGAGPLLYRYIGCRAGGAHVRRLRVLASRGARLRRPRTTRPIGADGRAGGHVQRRRALSEMIDPVGRVVSGEPPAGLSATWPW